MPHMKFEWNPTKFKILGIWFTNDPKRCARLLNTDSKFQEVKACLSCSQQADNTSGRTAILKSLILSKYVHLWLLLPNPPDTFIEDLLLYGTESVIQ